MIKAFLIFLIISIPSQIQAWSNFDECKILKEQLLINHNLYNFDENILRQSVDPIHNSSFFTFTGGIFFKRVHPHQYEDPETPVIKYKYMRNNQDEIIIDKIIPVIEYTFNLTEINEGSSIKRIDDYAVKDLSDDSIRGLLWNLINDDQEFEIEIRSVTNEIKTFSIGPLKNIILGIPITTEIVEIGSIDSSESTLNAKIFNEITWRQNGISQIGRYIFEQSNETLESLEAGINDEGINPGFFCIFPVSDWLSMNMYMPKVYIENSVNEEILDEYVRIAWSFDWKETNDVFKIIDDPKRDLIDMTLTRLSNHTIKTNFDYSAFPFDSQKLTLSYAIVGQEEIPFSPYDFDLVNSIKKINLDEWKINYPEVSPAESSSRLGSLNFNKIGLDVAFIVDRKFSYYLIKVYLPILIVLIVALSVLFISPTQLESRLTVSIVCLLALIAYTYVVDDELPKLSYLTVLDNTILFSYFFAAFPTIQSIYIYSVGQTDTARADQINKMSKILIPVFYLVTILATFVFASSSTENVIAGLKFL